MSLRIVKTNRFQKDAELMARRGKDIGKLFAIINKIAVGETLEPKYCDHPLKGDYLGCRDCHIEPDWVLIYEIQQSKLVLILSRTGTHSDLDF